MTDTDGMSLVLGGSAFGALCTLAGAWIRARYGRAKVEPQPLEVAPAPKFVTCEQCETHRRAMAERVDAVETMQTRVLDKLDLIEQHNEDRARRLHARLDPISESAAKSAALLANHLEDHRNGK